jgi:hypothetical protein
MAVAHHSSSGGGMFIDHSNPTLNNVIISENTAKGGGGMHIYSSNPALTHVTITGNTAINGGGMYLDTDPPPQLIENHSNPTLAHVTITGNTADDNGGGMGLVYSYPTLINSIIWNNSPESIHLFFEDEEPLITYSDIDGGWVGEGNIDVDPQFTDPENGDYTLMEGSPCIDAGIAGQFYNCGEMSPACEDNDAGVSPFDCIYVAATFGCDFLWADTLIGELCPETCGECDETVLGCTDDSACNYNADANEDDGSCMYDYIGVAPDMGAFEFGESSEIMAGDTNFDGIVDILDIILGISIILGNIDSTDEQLNVLDINQDGEVNVIDIVEMINYIMAN